ncbi:sushi, von Willebrand factor type A, EGF and pentraxin domain-containing protein 1-like [Patiria miniata]|uniref:Sushi domain-containing protein n=1 Tax=Patiria miniata TaxID=46514 RepID=A0A913Z6R7_PATMI|nr:sushi, von Willebrand factor type A, EGF and pentraxin domain-containing protein 1-like [Patiria miniata]
MCTPCSKLPELLNGLIVYNPELVNQSLPTVPHDTRSTYTCLYGFELQERHNAPQCYYGTWRYKTSEPVCSPKLCSQEDLRFGSVRYTKNNEEFSVRDQDPHHGVSRTFQCSRGYSLVSAQTEASVCVDGVWNTPLPACGPDACSRPAVAASYVEVQSLGHGGTARVTCDQGLKPSVGNGGLRCHAGHWVPDGIVCISSDAPSNVAYGRPASQSPRSDESNRQQASLAVDGDRTTDSEHGSCTSARKSGRQVFWEVDLQATYSIEYVDIYSKRKPKLIGATVQVGYPDATRESYSQCGLTISSQMVRGRQPSVRVDCNGELIAGQIIRIELQESDKLSLCEVEVFATGPIAKCTIPYIAGMRQTLEDDGGVLLTNAQVPPGTGIAYNCETGYQRNGAVDNLCRGEGTWARQLPACEADDCEVQDPVNGELDQRIRSIRHNSELDYSCNNGYDKENKVTRCELGVLTPGPPKCVHRRCSLRASHLTNVMINNQELEPDAEGKVYISHDTHVIFSCKRGYELTNNNRYTPRCWMGELLYYTHIPSCHPVRCRDPYLMYGSFRLIQGDRYEHGSTIRYECNPGYTLQDPAAEYSHCDDGRWILEPVCHPDDQVTEPPVAAATCPTPSVPNALIYHRGQNIATADFEIIFGNGDEIAVRCIADFTVSGREVVTATCRNRAWTPALPRCEVLYKRSCSRPGKITNVRQYVDDSIQLRDAPRTSFFHHSTIMSRCQDPLTMTLVTGPLRTCNDGRWTGPVPVCVRASTSFSLPALRTTLHQFMANGTLLIYPGVGQLNVDCIVSSGYPVLEHSHSQQWVSGGGGQKKYGAPAEGHSGTYTSVSCPEPRPPLNGRRIGDDFRLTKSVLFECNEGYDLIEERTIKCNLGVWLGEIPRCRGE